MRLYFTSALRWYFVRLWDGISLSAFALRDSIQNRLQSKINVCCEGKIIASWHFVRFSINSQKEKTDRQSFSEGGKLLLTGTLWLDFSRAWTATSPILKRKKHKNTDCKRNTDKTVRNLPHIACLPFKTMFDHSLSLPILTPASSYLSVLQWNESSYEIDTSRKFANVVCNLIDLFV